MVVAGPASASAAAAAAGIGAIIIAPTTRALMVVRAPIPAALVPAGTLDQPARSLVLIWAYW